MLRITVNKSAEGAKKYYTEHGYSEGRSLDDYYTGKNQFIGTWGGKGAEKLGLTGDINKSDFSAMCDNVDPSTGEKLTLQNKSDRRVGYDFTFDAGKSVSLAYAFGNDDEKQQILDAFRESVKETMSEMETGMQTRVRSNKQNENRETANLAYGEFIHFTTRPIDGIPDPQLHAHCFAFNATFDEQEDRWKAGQFGQIKQDADYYQASFHSGFANRLKEAGYSIEKTKNGFEISGIERATIEKFSNRSKEINELAEKENIIDNKRKSDLGAKTRKSKNLERQPDEIKADWKNRLTETELENFKNLKAAPADEKKKENAVDALSYSLNHYLERKSVATEKEILTLAIKQSTGNITPAEIKKAYYMDENIIKVKDNGQVFLTTKEALQEENNLITNAQDFKGRFKPINEKHQIHNDTLTDEQRNAVHQALTTSDGISIIAGKAGTGKTTLMKEIQEGINASGKQIFAFAPSAEASRVVQRKEGFENAETIARLLQSKDLQQQVKDGVIWIDEAGMVSNKQMNRIIDLAKYQNARIILTGDTYQHNSVERGDALRVLQEQAGYRPVMINKIQRQKDEQYKEAVQHLSKADTDKGFRKLDKSGSIHEIADHRDRLKAIAEDYYNSAHKSKSRQNEVLVLSPTHAEGEKLTEQIRTKLKEKKIVQSDEREFRIFRNLQMTAAEKKKSENYQPGNWLLFHQNIKNIRAGSKYEITGVDKDGVTLKDGAGNIHSVKMDNSDAYNVFEARAVKLAKGDKIRITGNGKAEEGVHLFNGTMYQVENFDKKGNIRLSNGSTLSKDYGTFNLGYVITSHASLGKTVDKVIISQSSMSFRASSKEQFYVSVSRGRRGVAIYTDDKDELLQAVSKSSVRMAATELVGSSGINARTKTAVNINRQNIFNRLRDKAIETAELIKSKIKKDRDVVSR